MQKTKILIIGFTWPEPATTAAGNRMYELLNFFLEEQHHITFASTANKTDFSLNLEKFGIDEQQIILNDSSFDLFVKKLNPDIVLFDRYLTEEQFGWRVQEQVPNALRILDTEDLHSLRTVRQSSHKKQRPFALDDWLTHDMTKREIASIFRCDLSLIISSFEMDLLVNKLKIPPELLLHLPFMVDMKKNLNAIKLPFENRNHFICMGNGQHQPNVDALIWLKKEIWPLLKKELPKAELHIYGAYLKQQIQEMHNEKLGFLIKGWAQNAQETMQRYKVCLAPLRFGAGIKGKLLLSMQAGTPSVTTTIGAEGMHGQLAWGGSVANTANDIANESIRHFLDSTCWQESQKNGFTILKAWYDKEMLQNRLRNCLTHLSKNLKEHRSQNFIGAMLNYQTMQATKYMSKWIEEKSSRNQSHK